MSFSKITVCPPRSDQNTFDGYVGLMFIRIVSSHGDFECQQVDFAEIVQKGAGLLEPIKLKPPFNFTPGEPPEYLEPTPGIGGFKLQTSSPTTIMPGRHYCVELRINTRLLRRFAFCNVGLHISHSFKLVGSILYFQNEGTIYQVNLRELTFAAIYKSRQIFCQFHQLGVIEFDPYAGDYSYTQMLDKTKCVFSPFRRLRYRTEHVRLISSYLDARGSGPCPDFYQLPCGSIFYLPQPICVGYTRHNTIVASSNFLLIFPFC